MEWQYRILFQFVVLFVGFFGSSSFANEFAVVDSQVSTSNYLSNLIEVASVNHVPRSVPPIPPIAPLLPEESETSPVIEAENRLLLAETHLNCDHVQNGIVQQFEDTLYLLSANQLFRVDVQEEKKELIPVATFDLFTENATDFALHPWPDNQLIVVVAFPTHYIVHKFRVPPENDDGKSFNRKQHVLQKILIHSPDMHSIKVLLFMVNQELYLLMAETNDQNSSSVISILLFRKNPSYFMSFKTVSTSAIDRIDVELFDQELLIMVAQYCRRNCHKNSIVIFDNELTTLQKIFTEAKFVKLFSFESEPRLISCITQECLVYFWDEKHFYNPISLSIDFEAADLATKQNHAVILSKNNTLHLYSRKEMKYADSVVIDDSQEMVVHINAIKTNFDKVYLIATAINETFIRMHFYNVQNDTNIILGSEMFPNLRDPFDEIESCANRLKNQLDTSFAMLTKLNKILPTIKTTTNKTHFERIIVNNVVTVADLAKVKEISLRSSGTINATETAEKLKRIDGEVKEMAIRANNLVLIDDIADNSPTARDNSNHGSSSLLVAKSITVKNLKTSSPLFNNLVTKSGRNFLKGHLSVGTLIVPNVNVTSGVVNNVQLRSLFINGGRTTVPIQGRKTIRRLSTDNLTINRTLNGITVEHLNDFNKELRDKNQTLRLKKVRAHELTADTINGIKVDRFFNDVYRHDPNLNSKIQGNLIISKPIRINNLITRFLNGVPVTDYFTLNREQVINRKVIFKNFLVDRLNAKLINDIDFANTVAVQGENNVIETPVRIQSMKVAKKLVLSDNEKREMAHHIVGTRVEDLTQSYTGRVVIKGDLVLHNVTLENPVNFFLDDKRFPLDSLSDFWKRDSHQQFTKKVQFKGRISSSQLVADKINGHLVASFVTTDQEVLQTDSNVHFVDTIIDRHFRTGGKSKVVSISRNAVRRGEMNMIKGVKHFENVSTNHLQSTVVNGQLVSDYFLHLNTILNCERKITFDELYLHSDLEYSGENLLVDTVDRVNMHSLFVDTVYINQPTDFTAIEIDQFVAEGDLNVQNLNGVNTNGALERINNLRFTVNVTGHAKVKHIFADQLNGVHVTDYFNLLVRRDRRNRKHELGGHKKFLKGFTVQGNLRVRQLSEVDLDEWMRFVLRWDENHVVTEEWVFKAVVVESLYANRINNIPSSLLINAHAPLTFDQDELSVNRMIIESGGRLEARAAHNWTRIIHHLRHPLPRKWQRIDVTGDILMPAINSKLGELITHGVNNRNVQTFTGRINFLGRTKVKTLRMNNRTISGIDLAYVLQDTLIDNVEAVQIVSGKVIFENGFDVRRMRSANLEVEFINDLNMINLNQSLWRPSTDRVLPPLEFHKIHVDHLTVNGSLNGVFVKEFSRIDLVELDQMELRRNFSVRGNLTVENMNHVPLEYFFRERGRLFGPPQRFSGTLTFENLVIRGASKILAINGVPMKSLLRSQSNRLQDVTGVNYFNNVHLMGPSAIRYINGVSLGDMTRSVVDKSRNQQLRQFNAKALVAKQGLEIRESLNDIPIAYFSEEKPRLPNLKQMERELEKILKKDLEKQIGKRQFRYFDHAQNLEIVPVNHDNFSYPLLNRFKRKHCGPDVPKCLCKRHVDIQLSKFNELQIHDGNEEIQEENLQTGSFLIHLSRNNSTCESGTEITTMWITKNESSIKTEIQGHATILGTIFSNDSSNIFITGSRTKDNFTVYTWKVAENDLEKSPKLRKIQTLFFTNSTTYHSHLISHKSNNLLIVSTNSSNQKLSWVYRFAPESEQLVIQHFLSRNYDLFSSVSSETDSFLASGLTGTTSVEIWKLEVVRKGVLELVPAQRISLKSPLKDLLAFKGVDQLFVGILLENGHLYIYRYRFIEGWIQESFSTIPGHAEKLTFVSNPLMDLDYLVVTGANSTANLISIN